MIVISSLDNYEISKVNTFVYSLNKSGFTGKKYMIVYECSNDVKSFLSEKGWEVIERESEGEYIVSKRFHHFYQLIEDLNTKEQVLICDCRDVYFHKNPEFIKPSKLYIAQDGNFPLRLNTWATMEIKTMYPQDYDDISDKYHLCAGVFYGEAQNISSLCRKTYEYVFESKRFDKNDIGKSTCADQMALNIVAYRDLKYKFILNNSIINLAQTFWKQDIEFFIYHQYDRVSNFKEKLINKKNKVF